MSSSSLKRPLELEQHLNANFMGLKRRCGGETMHQQTSQYHHLQQQQHLLAQPQQNLTQYHHQPQPHHNLTSSPFKSSILAPVCDEVARVIKDEITNNQSQHHAQQHQHHQHQSQSQQDRPVLTIRQTEIICEKLIKAREQKLREEYDRILMSKLAEQYETFVKYAHDHLEKPNPQHQASYLS